MKSGNKIKVLEVIQQGKIGGGESHLLTLLQHLDRTGFEPVVVALSDGEMIERLQEMGVRNHVVSTSYPFNPFVRRQIYDLLKDEEIDIVHTHGARSLSNIFIPARKLGIPVVHTIHGWSFHDFMPKWKKWLRIQGEKYLTAKARVNINVSASDKKIGEETFGLQRARVVNNGIDLRTYYPHRSGEFRKELKVPPDALVISFVARFIHDKNPEPLIKAFSRIQPETESIFLVMAGDGTARPDSIRLAETLGVSAFTRFPGFRTDIARILGDSDIFCLPSIKEGLPVSLIEAMAMKNTVIATQVQGCVDVVTHDMDGLLVSMNDLENELYAGLKKLVSEPETRKRLSDQAIQTVKERFDARMMTDKISEIYKELAG